MKSKVYEGEKDTNQETAEKRRKISSDEKKKDGEEMLCMQQDKKRREMLKGGEKWRGNRKRYALVDEYYLHFEMIFSPFV